jgi:hypothetical protein
LSIGICRSLIRFPKGSPLISLRTEIIGGPDIAQRISEGVEFFRNWRCFAADSRSHAVTTRLPPIVFWNRITNGCGFRMSGLKLGFSA